MVDAGALALDLAASGVVGVTITWADNNGIPRSRTVPVASLPEVTQRGVGVTPLFAVYDTHDTITFAHEGLSTPSGDVRLIPDLRGLTRLAGQPAFAWAPGRQVAVDGGWSEQDRTARGVTRLPATPAEQEEALVGSKRLTAVLGEQLLGAFLAVRRSDAAWAADRPLDDVVAAHRWRY